MQEDNIRLRNSLLYHADSEIRFDFTSSAHIYLCWVVSRELEDGFFPQTIVASGDQDDLAGEVNNVLFRIEFWTLIEKNSFCESDGRG